MIPWLLIALVAAVAALTASLVVRVVRRRRQARLNLRLLAGRRRLLGEEIEARLEKLSALTADERDGDRAGVLLAANRIIDDVHTGLVEREAHLQILDELAHLQRHKLAVLTRRRAEGLGEGPEPDACPDQAEPTTSTSARTTAAEEDPPEPDAGSILERRERLQDGLLQQIQRRGSAPPPRHRRR